MATILFDIDRTIFNTDRFMNDMQKTFVLMLGTKDEEFESVVQGYHDSNDGVISFVPADYLETIINYYGSSEEILNEKFYDWGKYSSSVYYDVFDALEQLSRKHEIGIYSEGDEEYQRYKLGTLRLTLFLNQELIFIEPNKTTPKAISSLPKDSYVIDDKIENLLKLKESGRVNPIWINRKSDEVSDEFDTIHNLEDLDALVK